VWQPDLPSKEYHRMSVNKMTNSKTEGFGLQWTVIATEYSGNIFFVCGAE
jgi:hypothetical protein